MNCVAITVDAHPQFYFFDECPVKFHDSQQGLFEKILPDDDNGFYDWLRDAEGALLGVRWFPHSNKSLLANNAKSLRRISLVTKKIYAIYPSNDCAFVDLKNPDERLSEARFNVESLSKKWESRDYVFCNPGGGALPVPNVTVLVGGALAVQECVKDLLFPELSNKLEFLPIKVAGRNWVIVNCLEAVSEYNNDASIVYRGEDQKIFMVTHLVIEKREQTSSGFFVIEDSNRSTIFAFQSFVEIFRKIDVQGLEFRKIGEIDGGLKISNSR